MRNRISACIAGLALTLAAQACGPTDLPTASSTASNATASANANEVRLVITLQPPPNAAFPAAAGKASWKSKPARRELEIEVEHLRPGRNVDFFLAGARVGTRQIVNALGQARIALSTQLGQPVPVSVAGKRVVVKTAAGILVVSGTF